MNFDIFKVWKALSVAVQWISWELLSPVQITKSGFPVYLTDFGMSSNV